MKVLVTGGAGYIGSVCVEQLLNAGHVVSVVDNLSEGHRSAVDGRARFHQVDLSHLTQLEAVLREANPEAIIHFAAHALVGESMADPGKYFRNNVAAGLNLLQAAVQSRVRKFVFSSTCATYGIPDTVPITENVPQLPVNPYGESKLMFEKILGWYHRLHGLEFVAFRYFNAAGASQRFGEHHRVETHLIPNVLKVPLGQATECPVFGTDYPTPDGTCIRDYIHVIDLAEAHIRALEPGTQGFFNLGSGTGYSVKQVIAMCEQLTGVRIPAPSHPRRPGDPPRLVASADRTRQVFDWHPRHPKLEDIVASAWAWHQRHPDGYPD
jgi:UDP-glucose 4-epimerase